MAKCPWIIVGASCIIPRIKELKLIQLTHLSRYCILFPIIIKVVFEFGSWVNFFFTVSAPFITMVLGKILSVRQIWKTTTDTLHRHIWKTRWSNLLVLGWPAQLTSHWNEFRAFYTTNNYFTANYWDTSCYDKLLSLNVITLQCSEKYEFAPGPLLMFSQGEPAN